MKKTELSFYIKKAKGRGTLILLDKCISTRKEHLTCAYQEQGDKKKHSISAYQELKKKKEERRKNENKEEKTRNHHPFTT
jgi:hypothetical protein